MNNFQNVIGKLIYHRHKLIDLIHDQHVRLIYFTKLKTLNMCPCASVMIIQVVGFVELSPSRLFAELLSGGHTHIYTSRTQTQCHRSHFPVQQRNRSRRVRRFTTVDTSEYLPYKSQVGSGHCMFIFTLLSPWFRLSGVVSGALFVTVLEAVCITTCFYGVALLHLRFEVVRGFVMIVNVIWGHAIA
jgi:hypothetical protein